MPCIRRRMCLPDALFSEAPFSPESVTFSNLIYSLVAFHRQRVAGEVISGRSPCHNSRMADQVTYLIFLVREAGALKSRSRGRGGRAPSACRGRPYSPNQVEDLDKVIERLASGEISIPDNDLPVCTLPCQNETALKSLVPLSSQRQIMRGIRFCWLGLEATAADLQSAACVGTRARCPGRLRGCLGS